MGSTSSGLGLGVTIMKSKTHLLPWFCVISLHIIPSFSFTFLKSSYSRNSFFSTIFESSMTTLSSMSNGFGQITGASDSNLDDKISSIEVNKLRENINYVAYRSVSVPLPEFGIEVPVAVWYPISSSTQSTDEKDTDSVVMENFEKDRQGFKLAHYDHKISLAKIGSLLVGWNLPTFLRKKYRLVPTLNKNVGAIVVNGDEIQIPTNDTPMVLMAHGYLGVDSIYLI